MLILTRRKGQSIIIRDDIRVTVLANEGGGVRIGIDAPEDVEIWREEIWDRRQNEKDDKDDPNENQ